MNKILIVDDEISNIQHVFNIFVKANLKYEILRALDANTALSICEKVKLDLIITDWDMPGISGIELIKKIRQDKKFFEIPVIMCTGIMTNSENLKTALDAGANDFIRKPIDELELISRTKSIINFTSVIKSLEEKKRELLEEKHQNLKRQFDENSKKLINFSVMISRYEKEMHTVANDLKRIYQIPSSKKVEEIVKQAVFALENDSNHNNWIKFKEYFDQVHAGFFKKLLQKYPDLTQNELKICAFIRLNMITKEIADITFQSTRSIEVARYRLRQKLNLNTNDNLYHFLASI